MKKILAISIICLFILNTASFFRVTGEEDDEEEVITSYLIDTPLLSNIDIEGVVYDRIEIDGLTCGGEKPGYPSLPQKEVRILIPYGKKVSEIIVHEREAERLGEGFLVEPVEEPFPFGYEPKNLPNPDKTIYNSEEMFPGKFYTQVGTYYFKGYKILDLLLHPVQYIPTKGELFYYPELTVKVETVDEDNINNLYRGLSADEQEVFNKIDNPFTITTYSEQIVSSQQGSGNEEYQLIIITNNNLKSGFETLKEKHTLDGMNTLIYTVEDIYNNYTGIDEQQKIRNFIRHAYTNWETEYILIGGDNDTVPARELYFGDWKGVEYFGPSDLYYACLDGPFNDNNNNKWGEEDDGENGDDVDLRAEVYVGRACVDNLAEVDNFVTKTIQYMNIEPDDIYLDNAQMAGERLLTLNWFGNGWGKKYLEQLIDECNKHYTTFGIPSDDHTIDKLYDKEWLENGWPIPIPPPWAPLGTGGWDKTLLMNKINNGVHLLNHVGHGNFNFVMKMDSSDVQSLSNNKHFFVYSQACQAGGFDRDNCIAEYLTVKTEHAAFAGIFNARLGFLLRFTSNSPTPAYHRQFWDAIFGEDITIIGKAHQDAKEDHIGNINQWKMRFCYYQLNLFGDPTLDLVYHTGGSTQGSSQPGNDEQQESEQQQQNN